MTGETIEQVDMTIAVDPERGVAVLQTTSGAQVHQFWMDLARLAEVIDGLVSAGQQLRALECGESLPAATLMRLQ